MFNLDKYSKPLTESGLRELMGEAADKIEGARAAAPRLSEVRGEGASANGLVRAQVSPGGAFETLEIDPPAMKLPSEDLAAAITEAAQAAFDDVSQKTAELLEEALPGAGGSLASMLSDPTKAAEGKFEPMEEINARLEAMRRGL